MVNIAVICVLDEEYQALLDTFRPDFLNDDNGIDNATVAKTSVGEHVQLYLFLLSEKGDTNSGIVAANIIRKYDISLAISFGIAGALSSDCFLGDVCVSSTVTDLS
ncbi:MAG: hypothetical protein ACLFWF_11860, partial [Alphaproteobacteria bacterium]